MTETKVLAPEPDQAIQYPIQILETRPESITWHVIFDHELDRISNISRPIILGLATTFLGCVIGIVPSFMVVITKTQIGQTSSLSDMCTVVLAGASAAFAVAFGFFAIRGQQDANKVKKEIRARRPTQVIPPAG